MRITKVSHFFAELKSSTLQPVNSELLIQKNIHLDVKRDDLIHPIVSGNKWRKLKHVLLQIEAEGFQKIAVMGGAYSNLLHSLSYLCMLLGWKADLYVRGHQQQKLTPMLQDAKRWGANINYVDRVTYRQFRENQPNIADDVFWITEGGYDELALKGSIESLMEINSDYDYLVIASATGTSLAGYCQGVSKLKLNTKVIGVAVLKNGDEIINHVNILTDGSVKPEIIRDYEFGGYAKSDDKLLKFIHEFQLIHHIPLEPVYSGKSFYAVMDLIAKDYFPVNSKILLIHCGGLQGLRK